MKRDRWVTIDVNYSEFTGESESPIRMTVVHRVGKLYTVMCGRLRNGYKRCIHVFSRRRNTTHPLRFCSSE